MRIYFHTFDGRWHRWQDYAAYLSVGGGAEANLNEVGVRLISPTALRRTFVAWILIVSNRRLAAGELGT